jgi:adenine/guanine phosphoribosyltransferase-like PRPP-binding protein
MARKKGIRIDSGYGWTEVQSIKTWTEKLKKVSVKLEQIQKDVGFDAIACSGSSGLHPAGILSIALQVPIIYVRKENETSHGSEIECNSRDLLKQYIILDDFVCSGSTVNHILSSISNFASKEKTSIPECVGVFLYACDSSISSMNFNNRKLKIYR